MKNPPISPTENTYINYATLRVMNRALLRNRLWLTLLVAGLTSVIFLMDILTPVGVTISMLFALPIYLTRFFPELWMIPAFALLCTGLNLLTLLLSPSGGIPWIVTVNRFLIVCLIWGVAYLTAQIKVLHGFIRVCSSCKKIEDEQGRWMAWEVYIGRRSEADFTHGICDDCAAKFYPDSVSERIAKLVPK